MAFQYQGHIPFYFMWHLVSFLVSESPLIPQLNYSITMTCDSLQIYNRCWNIPWRLEDVTSWAFLYGATASVCKHHRVKIIYIIYITIYIHYYYVDCWHRYKLGILLFVTPTLFHRCELHSALLLNENGWSWIRCYTLIIWLLWQ